MFYAFWSCHAYSSNIATMETKYDLFFLHISPAFEIRTKSCSLVVCAGSKKSGVCRTFLHTSIPGFPLERQKGCYFHQLKTYFCTSFVEMSLISSEPYSHINVCDEKKFVHYVLALTPLPTVNPSM